VSTDVALDVLRNDAFRLVAGELVLASGLVACVLSLLRGRKSDPSTLYFGVSAVLYGLRLIVGLAVLRLVRERSDWEPVGMIVLRGTLGYRPGHRPTALR
jgi:hypothetical protein